MTGRPDRTEPAEPLPLTDVTRWGLVGDIRTLLNKDRREFTAHECRVAFGQNDSVVSFRDPESREILFQLHIDGHGNDARFFVTKGTDIEARKPLDEAGGEQVREYLAEGIARPEAPSPVEQLTERELREGARKLARDYLEDRLHAIVWAPSERYLHLFALEKGNVGISVEHPSLDGTSMVETEDIVLSPVSAKSSLEIVPYEDFDDRTDEFDRERRRTEAARQMGFADRELTREELQRLYVDLKSGEREELGGEPAGPVD